MIVTSTEVQNNFGKYLLLAAQEEIIITRNGTEIARLTGIKERSPAGVEEEAGVAEKAAAYGSDGRPELARSYTFAGLTAALDRVFR